MNCFTVLGIEPTTEKKTIKRAYAAKSREFHPEDTRRNSRGSTMPMKRRLRGRSAMREERKSHRCLKSRGGWRWE